MCIPFHLGGHNLIGPLPCTASLLQGSVGDWGPKLMDLIVPNGLSPVRTKNGGFGADPKKVYIY